MRWMALLVLLSGLTVWAQERQVVPLRYELWWDERSFWAVGRLESTAPGDAKVLTLTEPHFFTGKFADGERLFALVKEDGEFVLYVDTDGDKDLTDERSFRFRQRGWNRVFGPIPMRFRVNGKTVLRHLGITVDLDRNGQPMPEFVISCRWRGTVLWDGKPIPITVVDIDCDGAIGEDDQLIWGEGQEERDLPAVGRIGINGRFVRYRVAPTGEELVIEPMQVPTATVRFQGERLRLMMDGEGGNWMLEGQNGQLLAPIGEFRLMGLELSRKDKQGRLWALRANAFGPAAPKLAISGSGATLTVEPLQISLHYDRKGAEMEFSLDIKTANGMSVSDIMVGEQRPPEPRLKLTANGRVIAEPQFHYG